jgi:hypothetical protein
MTNYAVVIMSMTFEERLALIPENMAPPEVNVWIPDPEGMTFGETGSSADPKNRFTVLPVAVEAGATREDIAHHLIWWCGELLECEGYWDPS